MSLVLDGIVDKEGVAGGPCLEVLHSLGSNPCMHAIGKFLYAVVA